jgi:gas vesicle structural protein
VIASVDTYLRFAEQVNRLDLTQTEAAGLAELRGDNDQRGGNGDDGGKAKGMYEGLKEKVSGD